MLLDFVGNVVTAPFKVAQAVLGGDDDVDALDLAFTRVDTDSDGKISAAELRAYIKLRYGEDVNEEVISSKLNVAGSTGELDCEGFKVVMRKVASTSEPTGTVPIGSLLDVDGDGEITRDEVAKASFKAITAETDLYKEVSRNLRRDTVYNYDLWKQHRSSKRIFRDIGSLFSSALTRGGWKEISFAVFTAAALVAWNDGLTVLGKALATFNPVVSAAILARPIISLGLWPWQMTSGFLSLLLVFRTNTAFGRFHEARCIWGSITNTCRDLARQYIWLTGVPQSTKKRAVSRCVAFPHTLSYHLSEQTPKDFELLKGHLVRLLGPEEAKIILDCAHKPIACLGFLSSDMIAAKLPNPQAAKLDSSTTILVANMGMCERIFKTPIPRVYTRHTTRFLATWLFTLPLGVYQAAKPKWLLPIEMFMVATFVLGIEELANVLEEPFSVLPLSTMNGGIEAGCFESLKMNGELGELGELDLAEARPAIDFQSRVVPSSRNGVKPV